MIDFLKRWLIALGFILLVLVALFLAIGVPIILIHFELYWFLGAYALIGLSLSLVSLSYDDGGY